MATKETTTTTEKKQEKFELKKLKSYKKEQVALATLIALDATPIPHASKAMRELDKQHLEHLYLSAKNGAKFPALEVVSTTIGNVVLNGNHRWNVYEKLLKEVTAPEKLEEARNTLLVDVEFKHFNTFSELMKFAFTANYDNGLPVTDGSRSQYALWLMQDAKENGQKLSMRQASIIAQVDHAAVSRLAKKLRIKEQQQSSLSEKMVDSLLSPDEKEELDQEIEKEDQEKADNALANNAKRFMASVRVLVQNIDTPSELASYIIEADVLTVNDLSDLEVISQTASELVEYLASVIKEEEDNKAKARTTATQIMEDEEEDGEEEEEEFEEEEEEVSTDETPDTPTEE